MPHSDIEYIITSLMGLNILDLIKVAEEAVDDNTVRNKSTLPGIIT
jgi:hypothetical protein